MRGECYDLAMNGTSDGNNGQETDNGDDTEPAAIAALSAIAIRFHAQAEDLRRRARRILLGVLGTVVGMTLLVIGLPPIINVAEDELLQLIGRQTSQLDAREETARQAADVRARSQTLLGLLRQRDELLGAANGALSKPHSAFAPENVDLAELWWAGDPVVLATAETELVQVAAGYYFGNSLPMIAFRPKTIENWSLWKNPDEDQFGTFYAADTLGDTVLVAGQVDNSAAVWRVFEDGAVELAFEIPPGLNEESLNNIEALSVSPDGMTIALWGQSELSEYLILIDQNGELLWRREIRGLDGYLDWRGSTLYTLVGGGRFGPNVHVFPEAAKSNRSEGLSDGLGRGFPLGFGAIGSNEDGIVAYSIERGRLRSAVALFVGSILGGDWEIAETIDSPDLSALPPTGEENLLHFGRFMILGGTGLGGFTRVEAGRSKGAQTLDAEAMVTPITLRANGVELDFPYAHRFDDGKLRLSLKITRPTLEDQRENSRTLFFVESTPPVLPSLPETEPALLSLLEGLGTVEDVETGELAGRETEAPIGGDATAVSAGLTDGKRYMAWSIGPFLDAVRNSNMVLRSEIFDTADKLEALTKNWALEWEERERSATILAQLRAADKTGDLWRNISSLVARLAVIALLIYLVNILVNLYRYNMRLAAFYQARGDAIDTALAVGADLSGLAGTSLAELAGSHTPEDVTFGARPAPPTEAILNAIKDVAKIAQG